jgi:curved DNA-binding protein CbpA
MSTHSLVEPSTPDHYFHLGVAVNATATDIKTAFRKLALLYHPDKNAPGADATKFRQIREAHDTLKDATARLAYDTGYPKLRIQWIQYRINSADHERRRRQQERGDQICRAGERAGEEAERVRRHEREEKERLAEERSRKAVQRAQREREQAAIELLRQLMQAEERDRLAREQERAQREKEAEARSAKVAERARIEQQKRALAQLQQDAAGLKPMEEAAIRESRYRRLFAEQQQAEAFAAKKASTAASLAQTAKLERIKIGRLWATEKHARYAASHPTLTSLSRASEYVNLGWYEQHGTATCDFCAETIRLYYFRCPLGDAIACGNCMNRLSVVVYH